MFEVHLFIFEHEPTTFTMLEHPNETKINELYKSKPAMRHDVVIQDLKVRHVCMNLLQW